MHDEENKSTRYPPDSYWGRAIFTFWVFGMEMMMERASKNLVKRLVKHKAYYGFMDHAPIAILEPIPEGLLGKSQSVGEHGLIRRTC